MNVRPSEMAQPVIKVVTAPSSGVPDIDTVFGSEPAGRMGAWPLLALGLALLATVAWNSFLLWQVAKLVFSWMGF